MFPYVGFCRFLTVFVGVMGWDYMERMMGYDGMAGDCVAESLSLAMLMGWMGESLMNGGERYKENGEHITIHVGRRM